MFTECESSISCEWAKQMAKKGLHKELTVCSFNGRTSFVCCPKEAEKPKREIFCDLIRGLPHEEL